MSKKSILALVFVLIVAVASGTYFYLSQKSFIPASNLLPMYGGENAVKTSWQLEADKKFIDAVVKEAGSREVASISIAGGAKEWLKQGDLDTAMKRFNQAWLLDPNNPEPYKGFAEILKRQGRTEEAERMLMLAQEKEAAR